MLPLGVCIWQGPVAFVGMVRTSGCEEVSFSEFPELKETGQLQHLPMKTKEKSPQGEPSEESQSSPEARCV